MQEAESLTQVPMIGLLFRSPKRRRVNHPPLSSKLVIEIAICRVKLFETALHRVNPAAAKRSRTTE
jgi:hypothetical protein